jgi:hypothetical protein
MRRARIMLHLDSLNFINKGLSVRRKKYVVTQKVFSSTFFVIFFKKICFELWTTVFIWIYNYNWGNEATNKKKNEKGISSYCIFSN